MASDGFWLLLVASDISFAFFCVLGRKSCALPPTRVKRLTDIDSVTINSMVMVRLYL